MALKGKIGAEIKIHSPATKFFNLFITQLHEVQNITDVVHQTKLHKGDWHGGKVVNCKEHLEKIDQAKKTILFNLFDGHASEQYKMLKSQLKVVNKGEEGVIATWTMKYEKLHEAIPPPQDYLDFLIKVTKDVDAHLLLKA
ncbi:MLP-like protein 43 [Senna tora]|uniref:MLP-like protein 43 n=1 Tax=Senna tora TaxID=362788 RepID=A0A834W4X4_9FABA|nr:MLP-like protein 43 [Senna tora]